MGKTEKNQARGTGDHPRRARVLKALSPGDITTFLRTGCERNQPNKETGISSDGEEVERHYLDLNHWQSWDSGTSHPPSSPRRKIIIDPEDSPMETCRF